MRCIVHRFIGIGLRQVGDGNFAAHAGPLLVPIGECGLAGNDLLCRHQSGKNRGGYDEDDRGCESHTKSPQVENIRGADWAPAQYGIAIAQPWRPCSSVSH
jgi:hypothetical protein